MLNFCSLDLTMKAKRGDDKNSYDLFYNGIKLPKIGESNRKVFSFGDYVIKMDKVGGKNFYEKQSSLDVFTWELIQKECPEFKQFFHPILYSGELDGVGYIIQEKLEKVCEPYNVLSRVGMTEKEEQELLFLEDISNNSIGIQDGIQMGRDFKGNYVIFDYAVNDFSLANVADNLL